MIDFYPFGHIEVLGYPGIFWNGNNLEEVMEVFPNSVIDKNNYLRIDFYGFLDNIWIFNINDTPYGCYNFFIDSYYDSLK